MTDPSGPRYAMALSISMLKLKILTIVFNQIYNNLSDYIYIYITISPDLGSEYRLFI